MLSHQQYEKECENVLTELFKAEDDHREKDLKVEKGTELPNTNPIGAARYSPLGCGKSRRNLTEVPKVTNFFLYNLFCCFFYFLLPPNNLRHAPIKFPSLSGRKGSTENTQGFG